MSNKFSLLYGGAYKDCLHNGFLIGQSALKGTGLLVRATIFIRSELQEFLI